MLNYSCIRYCINTFFLFFFVFDKFCALFWMQWSTHGVIMIFQGGDEITYEWAAYPRTSNSNHQTWMFLFLILWIVCEVCFFDKRTFSNIRCRSIYFWSNFQLSICLFPVCVTCSTIPIYEYWCERVCVCVLAHSNLVCVLSYANETFAINVFLFFFFSISLILFVHSMHDHQFMIFIT